MTSILNLNPPPTPLRESGLWPGGGGYERHRRLGMGSPYLPPNRPLAYWPISLDIGVRGGPPQGRERRNGTVRILRILIRKVIFLPHIWISNFFGNLYITINIKRYCLRIKNLSPHPPPSPPNTPPIAPPLLMRRGGVGVER